jgi:predicted ester cyclase
VPASDLAVMYRTYVAALNDRDFDVIATLVADEISFGTRSYARAEVLAALRSITDAVPDFAWHLEDLVVDGDRLGARLRNSGTPTAAWNGIEPTGRSFSVVEVAIYRVANGRFIEMSNVHDVSEVARQLAAFS